MRLAGRMAFVIWLSIQAGVACGQQLVFASVEEGQRILSTQDEYLLGMSDFDRSARMKTDQQVSLQAFAKFSASSVMEWSEQEKTRIEQAYRSIAPRVADLSLPLPGKVLLVKTSGKEEGHAAYTRDNGIFIPLKMLQSLSDIELQGLLAHELFHVSTRHAPEMAKHLYRTIGFEPCGALDYPAVLSAFKISNPDAPFNHYCIKLKLGDEAIRAMPLLLSYSAQYDVSVGGEFFDYLQVALLVVEPSKDGRVAKAVTDDRGPRLVGIGDVAGFFEQVGRNTEYIIHPEEILADNFSLLVMGVPDLPSPEVTRQMKKVLGASVSMKTD